MTAPTTAGEQLVFHEQTAETPSVPKSTA